MRQELPGHAARAQAGRARRRGRPHLLDRVERAGDRDDGGGACRAAGGEHGGQAVEVDGGGHGQDHEVLAQRPGVQEERQEQVGLQGALVHLVQNDGGNPGQVGVRLQAAQQQTGGDHLDARARAGPPLPAHRVADGSAQRLAEQVRQAPGGGAGGDAPGLGDDDAPTVVGGGEDPGDQGRDEGGLAGAGRGGHDDAAPRLVRQQPAQPGEGLACGQWRGVGEQPGERVGRGRIHALIVADAGPAPASPVPSLFASASTERTSQRTAASQHPDGSRGRAALRGGQGRRRQAP